MHRFVSILACGLALTSAPADESTVGLKVALVPEVTHIQPGQPFYVGLFIQHDPDFHTYWKMPGIVGVPTTIQWSLPQGWTGGELEYPEPERVLMYQIKAQGYERDVLLQARITPPADLPPGTTATLTGKAVWMCCAKSCHPGFKDLTLTLTVAAEPAPLHPQWHPVFEKERAAQALATTAWTAAVTQVNDNQVELKLSPASKDARTLTAELASQVLFFTEDGSVDSDEPHTIRLQPDGSLLCTLPLSDAYLGSTHPTHPTHLPGILQLDGGWLADGSQRSIRIDPPLP